MALAPLLACSVASAQPLLPPFEFARLLPTPRGAAGGTLAPGLATGPLLGVEAAWAKTLPTATDTPGSSGAIAVKAGWSFGDGLSVNVRYDDLGVEPEYSRSPLQLATFGIRYSVPFLIPLPFIELDTGPAFVLGGVQFGAGAALGFSVPLGPVSLDLQGRDWFVPIDGAIRQTISAGVGVSILFPSGRALGHGE